MKMKRLKRICFLLLTVLMTVSVFGTVFAADSSVTFENNQVVVFEPGSSLATTDLFDNFKGVMPGDTLGEEITIKNNVNQCDYIKVYMRAVLFDEAGNPLSDAVLAELQADVRRGGTDPLAYMYDFLAQLSMRVKNGGTEIYNASPDQPDGLANNVYLGTLREGESLKLDVELSVPIELDNRYANRTGEVGWVFVAEGFDDPVPPTTPTTTPPTPSSTVKPEQPSVPRTGEQGETAPWAGIALLAAAAVLFGIRRRTQNEGR
jgi:LPXTG-motif cell wall-anchored protein